MDEKQLRSHQRINDILLGPLERPALAWLAKKMPAWVTPDLLTGLGFAASILIFVSYWLTTYNRNFLWLASFGLLLNWFGDSLDGNLARYRKIERPRYGMFVDHVTDTLSEILVFVGVGLSPYVDLKVALFGLVAYLNVSILVYLVMITKGVFKISMAKIGPTEIRAIGILANAVIFFIGNPIITTAWGAFSLYNGIITLVAVMLLVFFIIESIHTGAELSREDEFSRTQRQEKEAERARRKEIKEREKLLRSGRKHAAAKKLGEEGV